jgi:hypothetical protein
LTSESTKPTRVIYAWAGAIPLCKLAGATDNLTAGFKNLSRDLAKALEAFPNVEVLKHPVKVVENLSIRLPRIWVPVGDDDRLEAGPWVFCEFFPPLSFRVHLPARNQKNLFPLEDERPLEDFIVLYNGTIAVIAAESNDPDLYVWGTGAAVRNYITKELFAKLEGFTPCTIPPCPLHLDFRIAYMPTQDVAERIICTRYPPNLCIYRRDDPAMTLEFSALSLFAEVRSGISEFYHLTIDADNLSATRDQILEGTREAYLHYSEILTVPRWRTFRRLRLNREISNLIGGVHDALCQHSVELGALQKSTKDLLSKMSQKRVLGETVEYFKEQLEPDQMDYAVIVASLENMRSHLLVAEQDRSLLYATIIGSIIALAGTLIGFFLKK